MTLARLEYAPDYTLGFGFDHWLIGSFAPSPHHTEDWNFALGFNLPLFFWAKNEDLARARKDLDAAREDLESLRTQTAGQVTSLYRQVLRSRETALLYRDTLIPLAHQAFAVALVAYQGGKADFTTLISTFRQHSAARATYLQAVNQLLAQKIALEQAAGGSYSPDFMTAEAEYLQAQASMPALASGGADNVQFARALVEAPGRKLELLGIGRDQIAMIKTAAPTFVMRAPVSGTVVQNQALRGAAVNPGDVLYSVGTLYEVWLTGDIYEDDLARVRVGEPLEAVTTAYPRDVFHGMVERISPGVDPNTHTLQIDQQWHEAHGESS